MRSLVPLVLSLLLALCTACGEARPAAGPLPTPTRIHPAEGQGAISGQLAGIPAGWEQQPLRLYAAPYLDDASGQGFYLLEPDRHASAPVEDGGFFQLGNMPPGAYVLVAGPGPEEARLLVDEAQQPRIVRVDANQALELGAVQIAD